MVHPIAEADERSPFGRLTPEEFYARHGVSHSTSSFVNPRGLRIFTQRWTPLSGYANFFSSSGMLQKDILHPIIETLESTKQGMAAVIKTACDC